MFWFSCGAEKPQTGLTCVPTANPIPRSGAPARAPFKLHTAILLALEVPAPFWVLTSKSGSCNRLNIPRSMNIKAHSGQETSREAHITVSTCGALQQRHGGRQELKEGRTGSPPQRSWCSLAGQMLGAGRGCRAGTPPLQASTAVSWTTLPPMWKSAIKRSNYPKSQPPSDK